MPVLSLTQSVCHWPTPEQVLQQLQAWAVEQKQNAPGLLRWPLEQLPSSCDALVLTPAELTVLLTDGSRLAAELQRDLRWML